jgi:peptide-methionine (S)-S-oxide reductase
MASALPSFISRLIRPFSNSTSLGLSPGGPVSVPEGAAKATVAAGCFWGVEHMYRKEFQGKGLYDARVGYIGGDAKNPNYRLVCSGRTGRTCPSFPPCCPFRKKQETKKEKKKKRELSANA